MNPINTATSSSPLQPAGSTPNKANADATTATNTAATANTAGSAATGAAANATGSSTVTNLSSIATQLQTVQAASASDSVYSTSKVNEIKLAISEGRFQVNSEKVANGLLDSVHDLLGSRQRG